MLGVVSQGKPSKCLRGGQVAALELSPEGAVVLLRPRRGKNAITEMPESSTNPWCLGTGKPGYRAEPGALRLLEQEVHMPGANQSSTLLKRQKNQDIFLLIFSELIFFPAFYGTLKTIS